ncbi:MAG: hypothetical protein ACYCPQ_03500 [Elusimicrobiota bacterium]
MAGGFILLCAARAAWAEDRSSKFLFYSTMAQAEDLMPRYAAGAGARWFANGQALVLDIKKCPLDPRLSDPWIAQSAQAFSPNHLLVFMGDNGGMSGGAVAHAVLIFDLPGNFPYPYAALDRFSPAPLKKMARMMDEGGDTLRNGVSTRYAKLCDDATGACYGSIKIRSSGEIDLVSEIGGGLGNGGSIVLVPAP